MYPSTASAEPRAAGSASEAGPRSASSSHRRPSRCRSVLPQNHQSDPAMRSASSHARDATADLQAACRSGSSRSTRRRHCAVSARHEPGGGGRGELDEVRAVGAAGRVAGGRGGQLLQAVPAQRLEQVVAHLAAVRVRDGDHQGLVDEPGEQLQRPRRVRGGVDGLGARQREPVLEDTQPGEQLPLGLAEQREAPVDDRPEAALPGDRRAGCRGEQVERPVEPARDLADADVAGPRGGQLDG